ncbi:sulfatase-like hydrolase/transferase [Variovorax sp. PCZ-1]|uniref:sulfatase family protein n=1 Tax=Variovorax sp. PCZ-1 TaxID=2835533 RepID=UPI001BCE609D|nr:sulfatase-like hydrolase/transferase [Variovorax sp. PCZ-1]MBS7806227.1 sulfatase-like hydrolase/transferase [Variovorax sp. PCZ-1]
MQRPNIIFIVADDLGYADLGCYGGRGFDGTGKQSISPNLDALAASGLRFTQGYSNSPVCSPTRFALMTARWQYRLRGALDEPLKTVKGSVTLGLPPELPTLPSMLRDAGYSTALIGKWHLGYPPHFSPLKSGYEEFFGPMSGGVDYFTHCATNGSHDLYFGEEEKHEEGYLTDLLSNRAVDYVQRMSKDGKPFFLSLHYTAPHWPWETRDDAHIAPDIAKNLFHLSGGNIHSYRKMIHHMDEGIGQLVQALRANGQLDNTLIVFTSDNGGERFSDNWPLVGGKMDLTEGGIRVPYIAHWPAGIQPGGVSQQHCLTMDWSATMLEAGGAQPKQALDGVSLLTVLHGGPEFERPLYWRMNHRSQRAYRSGDWKYLKVDENEYLFNIPADERERANHASREPQRLAQMRAQWETWAASMLEIPEDATVSLGFGIKDMPSR